MLSARWPSSLSDARKAPLVACRDFAPQTDAAAICATLVVIRPDILFIAGVQQFALLRAELPLIELVFLTQESVPLGMRSSVARHTDAALIDPPS